MPGAQSATFGERGLLRGMGEEILILVSAAPQMLSDWLALSADLARGDERLLSFLSRRNECCNMRRQGEELLSVVMERATPEQWVKWLQFPIERARISRRTSLADRLMAAGGGDAIGDAVGAGASASSGGAACGATCRVASPATSSPSCYTASRRPGITDTSSCASGGGCAYGGRSPMAPPCCKAEVEGCNRVAGPAVSSCCDGPEGDEASVLLDAISPGASACCTRSASAEPLPPAPTASQCCRRGAGSADVEPAVANPSTAVSTAPHCNVAGAAVKVGVHLAEAAEEPALMEEHICLHRATMAGDVKGMQELLAQGKVDKNATDLWECTALHRAAEQDLAEAVRLLIAADLDVCARDMEGYSPLHFAAARGASTCIVDLLQAGASVADRGLNGDTPLHSAVRFLSLSTVQVLLDWDADESARNKEGHTPRDVTGVLPDGRDIEDVPDPLAAASIIAALEASPERRRFRIWKRRAWIVILRARTQARLVELHKAAAVRVDGMCAIRSTCMNSDVNPSGNPRESEKPRLESIEKNMRCGRVGRSCCGGGVERRAGRTAEEFVDTVKRTSLLAEEGIFQNIVLFL